MGTITQRRKKDGTVRYRAEIRINKDDIKFSESKTFAKKQSAKKWLAYRESEIEDNPDILMNKNNKSMTLYQAIDKYLDELRGEFGRTQSDNLSSIQNMAISKINITKLRSRDVTDFAEARLNGKYKGYAAIKPQTLNSDLVRIRAVLKQAQFAWGYDVPLDEFEKAVQALRFSRKIKGSDKRKRLPTADELQKLTNYFYKQSKRKNNHYPMHLIIWFAIYSCRRQAEITRLRLQDYKDGWWLVRDMKNPNGSTGNHKHVLITDEAKKIYDLLMDDNVRQKMNFKGATCWDDELLIPVNSSAVSTRFTEACKVLGIKDLRFHDLRHEGATRLAEQGLTIPEIQKVTGHDSWSALQIYVNIKPRQTVLQYDEVLLD